MHRDLSELREEYQARGLGRDDLDPDAIAQFERWFDEWAATDPYDVNAMVLATADSHGRPSARFVLLKGLDEGGFVFYTNYESGKAADLAANPRAALCFGWLDLDRQVRVEGVVNRLPGTESDAYFGNRPRGSQLAAWASNQSRVVADRQVLETRLADLDQAYAERTVPRPDHWGGYRLQPDTLEFWQGRAQRLHDRFRYRHAATGGWLIERLAP